MRRKLLVAITADVYLSDAALWDRYRDQKEQAKISLTAIIGQSLISDTAVTVTPAEVEAYYAANKKEFERPRAAFMSFVSVPRVLDASDSAAALARVQAVRAELVGGAPFAEVAKRESSDGSAANGGELGTFGKGTMVPPFDAAAFSLPLNTLSQPVQTGLRVSPDRGDQAHRRLGHRAAHPDPVRTGRRAPRPGGRTGRLARARSAPSSSTRPRSTPSRAPSACRSARPARCRKGAASSSART